MPLNQLAQHKRGLWLQAKLTYRHNKTHAEDEDFKPGGIRTSLPGDLRQASLGASFKDPLFGFSLMLLYHFTLSYSFITFLYDFAC